MDSLFFWISKLAWLFIAPDNLLLMVLIAGVVALWIGKVRLSKWIFTVIIGVMLLIAFLPVEEWLLYPLESKYPHKPQLPQQVDGIIVLSGAENTRVSKSWGGVELNGAAERDTTFIELARRYPEAKLVFTGGTSSLVSHDMKGADIAKAFFAQQGLDIG